MSANDKQIGGNHYRTGDKQHWDWCVEHDIGYLEGCATKYIARWRDKNGTEDLEKSLHYIEKRIETLPRLWWGQRRRRLRKQYSTVLPFVKNTTSLSEICAIKRVGFWTEESDLWFAHDLVLQILEEESCNFHCS